MNIYLIGYRCTGKTTVGKLLAVHLEWDFIDTDDKIVEVAGQSIKEIVDSQGWEIFRKMERDVIKNVSDHRSLVIATGGGVIIDEENVGVMKRTGSVVWLKASAQTIQRRLSKDKTTQAFRPSLTQKGTIEEVRETLKKRAPYYESAMNFSVETDEATVEDVCREILKRIG
jgi:shikimate kinase